MEFIKKEITYNTPLKSGISEIGVDGDIIVPDILPDILKIIQVDGTACITDHEISGNKICINGRINLKILYIPDCENEKLKCIASSFDFSHAITNDNICDDINYNLSDEVTKVDFQLINSRKLKIKSAIAISYDMFLPKAIEIPVSSDDEEEMEIRSNTYTFNSFLEHKNSEFLVRESLELPSGQTSIGDLYKVDAVIYDTEYKIMSGRVVVKGYCNVSVLYQDTNQSVNYSDFEMPFTEILDLPSITEESDAQINFSIKDITYRTETDNDGDLRILYTEILICATVYAYERTEVNCICDCYCPHKKLDISTESTTLESLIAIKDERINLREFITPDKNAPKLSGIYNMIAKPIIKNTNLENDKLSIKGYIECFLLYVSDCDETPIYSVKKEIGFEILTDIENSDTHCKCKVFPQINNASYTLNSAGETEIHANLTFKIIASKEISIPLISDYSISEMDCCEKKGIVIYFVGNNETIWEVAKRYYVKTESIIKLNGLESEEITSGMRLVIPTE